MKVILIVVIAFEIFLLFRAGYNLRRINYYLRGDNKAVKLINGKIYILLPCHKEYEMLGSTLEFFHKFTKEHSNVKVIIITGREYENGKIIKEDSYTRLNKILEDKQFDNISILFDTNKESTKAAKLNYAVKQISSDELNSNTYIGVYDFDAKPHNMTLNWIIDDIERRVKEKSKLPSIYQQIPIILNGFNYKRFFVSIYSIWHIRRSLGIEGMPLIFKDSLKKIQYCMGSGMFIKYQDLVELNGFPVYSDDIALGYKLFIRNKKEVVVPHVNSVYATTSFSQCKKQHLKIYHGLFKFWEILREYEQEFGQLPISKKIAMSVSVLFDVFNEWLECGVLFLCLVGLFSNPLYLLSYYISFSIVLAVYMFFFLFIKKKQCRTQIPLFSTKCIYFLIGGFTSILFRFYSLTLYFFKRKKIKSLFFESTSKKIK
ncbi:hypothetical protein [Bacillus cereus]|uniref:hypothetical protein n=1 Tax=Bacillus cereus TaxID=1396 RepID=UPI0035CAE4A3